MTRAREILEDLDKREKIFVEMANLRSKDTGLSDSKYMIYISTKQGSHGPRVKVFKLPEVGKRAPYVAVSIEVEPKVLVEKDLQLPKKIEREVKYWVSINHVVLLKLWNAWKSKSVVADDLLTELEKINND